MEINYAIRWIVIYPVDSANQRLNNRGQEALLTGCRIFISGGLWGGARRAPPPLFLDQTEARRVENFF